MSTLRDILLPALVEQRRESKVLRIWSAGCSTGEELYSISILLDELLPDREQWNLSLVGTDLDASAVMHARAARYKPWSMRVVLPEERLRYFHEESGTGLLRLRSRYQQNTSFHVHNLVDGKAGLPSPGRFDLILCRNVLIYFSDAGQREVADTFRNALAPGGLWITGASDPSPGTPWLTTVHPGLITHAMSVLGEPQSPEQPSQTRPSRHTTERRSTAPTERPPSDSTERSRQLVFPLSSPSSARYGSPVASSVIAAADEQQHEAVMRLADAGKLAEAAVQCEALTERLPLWPKGHLLAATIAQSSGQPSAAIIHLKRALYLEPTNIDAHLRLGLLLAQTGSRAAAIKALRNVMLYGQELKSNEQADVSSTASRLLVQLLREEQT